MASASTRLKSPFFISSASSLRPVGLIRSPIIVNGRPNPITASRVAELRMVSVTREAPDRSTERPRGGRATMGFGGAASGKDRSLLPFGIVAVFELFERQQFVPVDVVRGHVGYEPAGVGELAEVLLRVLRLERRPLGP